MMCSPVFEWASVVWPKGIRITPALNAVPSMPLHFERTKPTVFALGGIFQFGCCSRFDRIHGGVRLICH
jgi:hypothetical protein